MSFRNRLFVTIFTGSTARQLRSKSRVSRKPRDVARTRGSIRDRSNESWFGWLSRLLGFSKAIESRESVALPSRVLKSSTIIVRPPHAGDHIQLARHQDSAIAILGCENQSFLQN